MSIDVVYDLLHSLRTSYLELILKTSRRAEIRHLGNRYVPFWKLCTTTHLGILILDANGCTSNLHRLIQVHVTNVLYSFPARRHTMITTFLNLFCLLCIYFGCAGKRLGRNPIHWNANEQQYLKKCKSSISCEKRLGAQHDLVNCNRLQSCWLMLAVWPTSETHTKPYAPSPGAARASSFNETALSTQERPTKSD